MHRALLLIMLFLLGCNGSNKNESHQHKASTSDLNWLVGKWVLKNNTEDQLTYETWKKVSETTYQGIGITLTEGDTSFYELMVLEFKDSTWSLQVSGIEDQSAVTFDQIELSDSSFIVQNEKHDFPTHIHYWKKADTLYASVWNEEQKVDFSFIPKPN